MLKTIRIILKPSRCQWNWLLRKAQAIPNEFRATYEKGKYPKGCARIINNALQKLWQTCRSTKQIPIDKQFSKIVKRNKALWLKIQTQLIPFRLKEVEKLDDLLLNHYNSAVVWLKGNKWVADIAVEISSQYLEGKPEAVVGVDLGKWHNAYSIWLNQNFEVYRAFDKFGDYHFTMRKIMKQMAIFQRKFQGSRKQLSKGLKPYYEKKRMVLRQYFGTLRNKILKHIPEGYNAVFVLEDLDTLPRAELRKAQRTWAHQELANRVFRKGIEWNGYKIVLVNPRGTTHTCWKCGKLVKSYDDRKIICETCYPKGLDRDLNGARNIARRYMLSSISQHTCSENDRLSSVSHVQTVDNREKVTIESASNELPTLVADRLQ